MNGVDPLALQRELWPDVTFYKEQKQIIRSIWENDETYVPAANMMGKDFVAGFIVLAFFITRHPCRIIPTSAKEDHLDVLWGEIGWWLANCKYPLRSERGGPLLVNHQHIRMVRDIKDPSGKVRREVCPMSYLKSMVANEKSIAAMQGHHIKAVGPWSGFTCCGEKINTPMPRTMFLSDESSSVMDDYYAKASTWMNRAYIFGNTWPCSNFFYRGVKDGDLLRPNGRGYYRKVIRIKAEQSPNVQLGIAQKERGIEPTNEIIVPGVKQYTDYIKHRAIWDKHQQCVSLDAEFYEGMENRLFPSDWLNVAEQHAQTLDPYRKATHIGIDPAEGGDRTAMAAVDKNGLIKIVSKKTPDTSVIIDDALSFMRELGVRPENVIFDLGGGGRHCADQLRRKGYRVRAVSFGEAPKVELKRGITVFDEKKEIAEERYIYKNRRAEMYGTLSDLLNPALSRFGLPKSILRAKFPDDPNRATLREQLEPIPKYYDEEGRLYLPPKHKKPDATKEDAKKSVEELVGCSPDESDALALAVFGMMSKPLVPKAGAAW